MFLTGVSNCNITAHTCGLLVCVLNQLAFLINSPIPNWLKMTSLLGNLREEPQTKQTFKLQSSRTVITS